MDLLKQKNKKGGFAPILIGIAMLIILTIVLFNNEGNSVHREKALKNIKDAHEISSDETSSDYDNQLVTFYGMTQTNQPLTDDIYNVSATDVIKLQRIVTMYQWEETASTDDGTTTYSYALNWSESLIDSSKFNTTTGHENPTSMPASTQTFSVDKIQIGEFTLGNDYIKQLNNYSQYKVLTLDPSLGDNVTLENSGLYISMDQKSNLNQPKLGDIQVNYQVVTNEVITVLGEKKGTDILPYSTKTGDLAEVSYGEKGKEVLMNEKLEANKSKTWAIRIGSLIGLMIAIGMIFSPISNLLGKIPIIGNIVNGGVFLIALVFGGGWGLLVIAIGWLFYKPLLAIILLAIPVTAIELLSKRGKKETAVEA